MCIAGPGRGRGHLFRVGSRAGLARRWRAADSGVRSRPGPYACRERRAIHRRAHPTGCSIQHSLSAKRGAPRKPGSAKVPSRFSYAAIALAKKIFGDLKGRAGADSRRRRDGQAHRHSSPVPACEADHDCEPYASERSGSGPPGSNGVAVPVGIASMPLLARPDIVVTATGASETRTHARTRGDRHAAARRKPSRCSSSTSPCPGIVEAGGRRSGSSLSLQTSTISGRSVQENLARRGAELARGRSDSSMKRVAKVHGRGCSRERFVPTVVALRPAASRAIRPGRTAAPRAKALRASSGKRDRVSTRLRG